MQHWDSLCGFVEGDEVHVARRAEDAAALALLDATLVWLDFVEHSYLERPDWVRPEAVVDRLEATVRDLEATAVFAPFGLGNPDHDCTHDAAVACYPSQLLALEAEWAIGGKLAAPAPEQFWRLAPPPKGWEGLRDAI
jgi:LmbE family N-acetylglucosaminyl deacetylase